MLVGVSEILTSAVGVAISPVAIVAVTLMLFSQRARANGPAFLAGWVVALVTVSGVAYILADNADAATDGSAADTIAWGKISFGVLFLLLAVRTWRDRPAPGAQHELPKWMAGIDVLKPGKALGLGLLLAGVSPKNLMLAAAAGAGLAELGLSTGDAIGSLIVFVCIGSITIGRSSTTCPAGRGEGSPRRAQGLARHAQRRCDGGPLSRPGLQAHRRRPAATWLERASEPRYES
jgi:Sap, sulfolipid-1-addressing protein